jgi:hypothetical protein
MFNPYFHMFALLSVFVLQLVCPLVHARRFSVRSLRPFTRLSVFPAVFPTVFPAVFPTVRSIVFCSSVHLWSLLSACSCVRKPVHLSGKPVRLSGKPVRHCSLQACRSICQPSQIRVSVCLNHKIICSFYFTRSNYFYLPSLRL